MLFVVLMSTPFMSFLSVVFVGSLSGFLCFISNFENNPLVKMK